MIPFQNPTVYLGGIRIDEPITTLTDFLFAGVCFFAFFKTAGFSAYKGVNLYRWFFLLTGVSTIIAALIGHAFLYAFGWEAKIYGWVTAIISVSFAQFAVLYHTRTTIGERVFKILFAINVIEIIAAFVITFVMFSFVAVEIHTAYILVANVTVLEYLHYKKTGSLLSKYLMYGVGIAVIAVMCHIFKLAFSVWFNHLDLSHIFMSLSMYVMYKAVANFKATEIH